MGNCVAGVGPEVTPIPGMSGFGAGFQEGKMGGLLVVSKRGKRCAGSLKTRQIEPLNWNAEVGLPAEGGASLLGHEARSSNPSKFSLCCCFRVKILRDFLGIF